MEPVAACWKKFASNTPRTLARQSRLGNLGDMVFSENRGTLFGGPFKGILFYLGMKGIMTPILGNAHMPRKSSDW